MCKQTAGLYSSLNTIIAHIFYCLLYKYPYTSFYFNLSSSLEDGTVLNVYQYSAGSFNIYLIAVNINTILPIQYSHIKRQTLINRSIMFIVRHKVTLYFYML